MGAEPPWRAGLRLGVRTEPSWLLVALGAVALGVLWGLCAAGRYGGDLGALFAGIVLSSRTHPLGRRASQESARWWGLARAAAGSADVAHVWTRPNYEDLAAPWGADVDLTRGHEVPAVDKAADNLERLVGADWVVSAEPVRRRVRCRPKPPDPLAEVVRWPYGTGEARWDVRGLPMGTDEGGRELRLPILETHYLIGGVPGSGKSGLLTAILAALGPLEHVALIGLDPKRVELAPWRSRMAHVESDEDTVCEVLKLVIEEMDRRYEELESKGAKKVTTLTANMPLLVLIIDELADLVSVGCASP